MGEIRSSPLTNEKEESRPKCIMRTLLINTTQIKPIDTKNITPITQNIQNPQLKTPKLHIFNINFTKHFYVYSMNGW